MSSGPVRRPGESALDFAKRRAQALGYKSAQSAPAPAPVPPTQAWDNDLIPDTTSNVDEAYVQERLEIDAVLGNVDVLQAYAKWCGKMTPNAGNKTRNIMVSCPLPGHEDKNPSASIDLTKGDGGVWACHRCDDGGDKYDLAAIYFGYDRPGYKGKDFPELRRKMAQSLGYTVHTEGKAEWLVPANQPTPSEQSPVIEWVFDGHLLPAKTTPALSVVPDEWADGGPSFDWRTFTAIQPGTFLHEWLTETSRLHEPEEFYFFGGLIALGSAVGNNVLLDDEPAVRANTMTCLVGTTGSGKSRALGNTVRLIADALPFNRDNAHGVKLISSSGSGEDLIGQFMYKTKDSTTGDVTAWPVNGVYEEDELEGLMARVSRPSSTFRSTLMKFFDTSRPVSTSSRTGGLLVAEQHFMQLVSTTQPQRLGDLTSSGDASSGFLNRWFFVFGKDKFRPAITSVRLDPTKSIDLLRDVRAWASSGQRVMFSDPVANDRWEEFVQSKVRPIEAGDFPLAGRIALQCKKLLLLLAINDRSTSVTMRHMETLESLFPYVKACYGIVEENIGKTHLEDCAQAIIKYMEARPDQDVTDRILAKQSGARKYDLATRVLAMEKLVKSQAVIEVKTQGQVVSRYRYVADTHHQLATVTPIR